MNKQKGLSPILIILVIAILGIAGYFGYQYFQKAAPKQACTQEAKLCPDGSSVGRTGPNCEFAPCPTASTTANWKTYINPVENFSFMYPPTWTIDTKGENGDERGENIIVKLSKGEATIQIYANMMGIGGVGRDYQGTPVIIGGVNLFRYKITGADDKTIIIGFTDELTQSLGLFRTNGKTYGISMNYPVSLDKTQQGTDLEKEFDMIFSTFKFAK